VEILINNTIEGVPHLVAHRGVHKRVELRLGLDLVVEDALRNVDDLDDGLLALFKVELLCFYLYVLAQFANIV